MTAVRLVIRALGESRSRRFFDNQARGPRRKFDPKTKMPRMVKIVRGACEHACTGRDRDTNGRGPAFETPLALLFIMTRPTPPLAASALLPASEGLGDAFGELDVAKDIASAYPGTAAAPRHRRADVLERACDTECVSSTVGRTSDFRARPERPPAGTVETKPRKRAGAHIQDRGPARNDLRRPFGFSGISPRQPVFMVVAAGKCSMHQTNRKVHDMSKLTTFRASATLVTLMVVGVHAANAEDEDPWDIRVGAGALYVPEYEGSDDMTFEALPLLEIEMERSGVPEHRRRHRSSRVSWRRPAGQHEHGLRVRSRRERQQ